MENTDQNLLNEIAQWMAECQPDPKLAGTPEAEERFLEWLDGKAEEKNKPLTP